MNDLLVTHSGYVLDVRLNRPQKKNALSFAMYEALIAAFTEAGQNPSLRVVLLSAVGDVFSAGNDINDFLANPLLDAASAPPIRFIDALVSLEKPLVVAVHGAAVGIGTTMLLHADLVIADESARFSVPFAALGLVPEAASSLLLPRRIGPAAASDMLLRGAVVDARRAAELGLINEVATDALATARARADEIAAKPPTAVRLSKALLRGDRAEITERVRHEAKLFAERVASDEAREAFSAFLERRPPDFSKFV